MANEQETGAKIKEILDRTRRLETRLTSFMQSQGFDVRTEKPVFSTYDFTLTIPSMRTQLQDIIDAVPSEVMLTEEIEVIHKGEVVAMIYKPNEDD